MNAAELGTSFECAAPQTSILWQDYLARDPHDVVKSL